jgi:hypothetical protein
MASFKVFISYSWDSPPHKTWVRTLAVRLQENGVNVLLDQWDTHPGLDLTNYMESSVRESTFVLLVCTPAFAERANTLKGGVGYEKSIVTGEIFSGSSAPGKFVPLLRSGEAKESLPSYLKSRVFIDFRREADFDKGFESLLRHLYAKPAYVRPPLGEEPPLNTLKNSESIPASFVLCARCGRRPGEKGTCIGKFFEHDFRKFEGRPETVFCHRCGVGISESTPCVGKFFEHAYGQFSADKNHIYCRRCGCHPGEKGTCIGKFFEHDFQSL